MVQCWCDISNLLECLLEPIYYGWAWAAEWETEGEHQVSEKTAGGPLGRQMVKHMLLKHKPYLAVPEPPDDDKNTSSPTHVGLAVPRTRPWALAGC